MKQSNTRPINYCRGPKRFFILSASVGESVNASFIDISSGHGRWVDPLSTAAVIACDFSWPDEPPLPVIPIYILM